MRKKALAGVILGSAVLASLLGLQSLKPRKQSYDQDFFQAVDRAARQSADTSVPELVRLLHPRSVVDVGSGNGYWANAFLKNGVSDTVAIDGPWAEKNQLKIPPDRFVVRDLSGPLRLDRTFDLVLCLETAEHLRPERAASFIQDITKLAPLVVFSAAIPGHGGTMHYNEQWPGYWAEKFAANSFVAIDALRPLFWSNDGIAAMYRQNMILYVRKGHLATRPDLQQLSGFPQTMVLPLVHPQVLRNAVEDVRYASRWQTKVKKLLGMA